MNSARQLPARLPLIVLAATLLIVYHRLLLGEVFIWGLPTLQFYPWRAFALDLLQHGQLPLWNPYNGAGAPLLANYQSALLYPPSWLSLVLPLAPTMSITAVVHLFIAGWGMWTFTGRLGYSTLGRGMSALAFAMTSYLVGRLGTFPIVSAAAWLPWLCWAALGGVTRRHWRDMAWLASFTALLLLAGHAQTAWYSLMLVGIFGLWRWLRNRPLQQTALLLLAGGAALGIGIAAVQITATGELLLSSQRSSGVDYDFAMNFSYEPVRALNLISPNIFGNPGDGTLLTENDPIFEDAVYVGLIPLVSALAAVIAWLRTRRDPERPQVFGDVPLWFAVIVVAFVFALGKYTPIFPFLYEHIPTFDLFQAPVRWHLWTTFGLSVLAGAGVAAWGRSRRARRWTARLTTVCIAALLVGLLAPDAFADNDNVMVLLRGVFMTGLIGTAAGILTLLQPDPTRPSYGPWSLAALALVAVDLAWAAGGLNPTYPASFTLQSGDPSAGRGYWSPQVEEAVKFDTFLQVNDYRVVIERWDEFRASRLANLNLLDGVALLDNFDPLRIGTYQRYLELLAPEGTDTTEAARALLQAANVTYTFSDDTPSTTPLPASSARAWLVDGACWHADDDYVVEALLAPDWNPDVLVHLTGSGACDAPSDDPTPPGEVLSIDDRGNALTIAVNVERPAWLVLADSDYPGWHADIDGAPTTIQRANLAFRAVAVLPGASSVHFVYHPDWLIPSAFVTGISLLGLLVLFRLREAKG